MDSPRSVYSCTKETDWTGIRTTFYSVALTIWAQTIELIQQIGSGKKDGMNVTGQFLALLIVCTFLNSKTNLIVSSFMLNKIILH